MDWIISAVSIVGLWLAGNKSRVGWLVMLFNQILWAVFAVSVRKYGLLVGVVAYSIVQVRNYIKWSREEERV